MKKLQLQEKVNEMVKNGYSDAYIEACLYASFNDIASIRDIVRLITIAHDNNNNK